MSDCPSPQSPLLAQQNNKNALGSLHKAQGVSVVPALPGGQDMSNTSLLYWERSRLIFASSLPAREKFTLLAISDHLGSNPECWPSVARLQLRTGQSRTTILRSLQALEQCGALHITRSTGSSHRYSICVEWLQAHPSQIDTGIKLTPVSNRHPHPSQIDTGGVSDWHGGGIKSTPKGVQEGNQGRNSGKGTNSNTRKTLLSIPDVVAIAIPDELTEALPGYAAAFEQWVQVRKGREWRRSPQQTIAFHRKMLRAHDDGKDVLAAMQSAFECGWSGIKSEWMQDRPRARDTKQTPALTTDYTALYRAQILGGLK